MMDMWRKAKYYLKKYYGYDDFRAGQKIIIENILNNRDILGILPTGGGKSICYQIPALLFDGVTIVISPLISLMKDQVDTLNNIGIPAVYINSSLNREEYIKTLKKVRSKRIKLIYVAPERLVLDKFYEIISSKKISLIAVDEAHCISQWGHDFRKSYLEIPKFIERLEERVPIAALTATATPKVRSDILDKLSLLDPMEHISGFGRENLALKVLEDEDSFDFSKKYLEKNRKKSGIIYASTRKQVDTLHTQLATKGFSVSKYHAGLNEKDRKKNQEDFLYDRVRVMIATNAFGMGIDKSNVRFVLHCNIPKDIESYYQEAGRAGRDGAPAECVLIYNEEDIGLHEFFIESNKETNPEYKKEKYLKLQKMVEYCHTQTCFTEYILKYFGDEHPKSYCGHCSNCKKDENIADLTLRAQKVFSCIGRMKQKFGISTVVSVLLGEEGKKIEKNRFNLLSTYGILSGMTRNDLSEFIEFLILGSYLELTNGSYPALKLTEKAYKVISGMERVFRKLDAQDFIYEDELFEMLSQVRENISKREGLPPYIILSDATLIEMAEKRPKNRWEMLQIRGVGNQKFKSYGAELLKAINSYKSGNEKNIFRFSLSEEKLSELSEKLNLDMPLSNLKEILCETLKNNH